MIHDFVWYGGGGSATDFQEIDNFDTPSGPTAQSSAVTKREWVLDKEAFLVATTDQRHLSRSIFQAKQF